MHATNETAAVERLEESVTRVQTILPNCEVAVLSPAEIAFRWRGLEFARARMGTEAVTFRSRQEIVFGVGAEERVVEDRNWPWFAQLLTALRDIHTDRAKTVCFGCTLSAGWNRWCAPTLT